MPGHRGGIADHASRIKGKLRPRDTERVEELAAARVLDRPYVTSVVAACVAVRSPPHQRHRPGEDEVRVDRSDLWDIAIAGERMGELRIIELLHHVGPEASLDTERNLPAMESSGDLTRLMDGSFERVPEAARILERGKQLFARDVLQRPDPDLCGTTGLCQPVPKELTGTTALLLGCLAHNEACVRQLGEVYLLLL